METETALEFFVPLQGCRWANLNKREECVFVVCFSAFQMGWVCRSKLGIHSAFLCRPLILASLNQLEVCFHFALQSRVSVVDLYACSRQVFPHPRYLKFHTFQKRSHDPSDICGSKFPRDTKTKSLCGADEETYESAMLGPVPGRPLISVRFHRGQR